MIKTRIERRSHKISGFVTVAHFYAYDLPANIYGNANQTRFVACVVGETGRGEGMGEKK